MMKHVDKDSMLGAARSRGPSWDEILAESKLPVPEFLKEDSYRYLGSEPLAADRYTCPDFFREEIKGMWPYVWQFAARDEDMPDPGDHVVYENAGRTYLVVRQDDGSVRAFHNVCLHRGRKLRTTDGSGDDIQCPFHGFTWNNDGSLKEVPCRWDFAHLDDRELGLPEVSVARWAGFIFVRESAEGPTIEEYIAPLHEHFKRWQLEECRTVVWAGKVLPVNWKLAAEVFMEAWHSIVTHPQLLAFLGDENTRYDIYGDHANRALTPGGVLSPHLQGTGKTEQWIAEQYLHFYGRGDDIAGFRVPEGMSARQALGAFYRERLPEETGRDMSDATDGELLDPLVYNIFPNFSPWGGFMPNIVYRWRPWPDQDHTLMEVRILMRFPEDKRPVRSVPMRLLGDDERWSDVAEWGYLGEVFEQDMANLPHVQEGLRMSRNNKVQLGNYQEIRIRQFQQTLDKYLDAHRRRAGPA